ncbi:hypothetical protein RRG08_054867 [Elysia crispata]|uniref:Uncharacterized protein n=1 Tax=Elysia crispata TaxID=231223 RepID=A0AAE1DTY3_9GAST|nr:hypothetical protein RRG08_054867 [Elysia crispata]
MPEVTGVDLHLEEWPSEKGPPTFRHNEEVLGQEFSHRIMVTLGLSAITVL